MTSRVGNASPTDNRELHEYDKIIPNKKDFQEKRTLLPFLIAATSSSSKKITCFVCSITALASEAKKYSMSDGKSAFNIRNSVVTLSRLTGVRQAAEDGDKALAAPAVVDDEQNESSS
uniref:Uncharacterized protein n=1 Tax=Romanomermis culicivorax TaxID=13658 RepID=A0A915IX64_ROMCU